MYLFKNNILAIFVTKMLDHNKQVKLILEVFIGNLPEYLKNSLARAVTVA